MLCCSCFQANIVFKDQLRVSSEKFRECFKKVMIATALFKLHCGQKTFEHILAILISCEIYTVGRSARNTSIQKWDLPIQKLKPILYNVRKAAGEDGVGRQRAKL